MFVRDDERNGKGVSEHGVTKIDDNRVHAEIDERTTGPPALHIDDNIEQYEEKKRASTGHERERERPEVLVDRHPAVLHVELSKTQKERERDKTP